MAPSHSVCFCNNRGGVGKTFMAFQTACEAARARPDKKVLVFDFSLYSDITALLLGGSAREGFGAPMKGLQVTVENTTEDTRAEGLIRDLEHAMDVDATAAANPPAAAGGSSIFGAFFSKKPPLAAAAPAQVDLNKYLIRPADFNPAIPPNLYLVPSAGAVSWSEETTGAAHPSPDDNDAPLWTRKGEQWWPVAQRLRAAVEALSADFDAVMIDTDHLAACVLTKLALAVCDSVVVPLSFDDRDFNRLFQDVTGNALFTDVMIPMRAAGHLRARVHRMVFTRVSSNKNEPTVTAASSSLPFTPPKVVMDQIDHLAQQTWAACMFKDDYRLLFKNIEEMVPTGGNLKTTFCGTFFTGMKQMPDLATNISNLNGIPICTMTGEKYRAPSGLEGQTGKPALDSIKAELQVLVMNMLGEEYNKPLQAS